MFPVFTTFFQITRISTIFKVSSCILYEKNPFFYTYNLQQIACRYFLKMRPWELVEKGSLNRNTRYFTINQPICIGRPKYYRMSQFRLYRKYHVIFTHMEQYIIPYIYRIHLVTCAAFLSHTPLTIYGWKCDDPSTTPSDDQSYYCFIVGAWLQCHAHTMPTIRCECQTIAVCHLVVYSCMNDVVARFNTYHIITAIRGTQIINHI